MNKTRTYIALLAAISMSSIVDTGQAAVDDDADPLDQTVPVADEDIDTANPELVESISDTITEEKLLEEFARYRRMISEGTLDEADIAAKRIVEMAISVYGPESREMASALNNLGIVQHGNRQYDAAIQNFETAVGIIESVEDRLNTGLVNPLKGLGAAQLAIGRPDEANRTFFRAAHITHVNDGPHNIGQVEILESIAETELRMGETKQARKTLDRIHILNVRFFEQDPMGLIPSLMSRANWQHRAGYYTDERATYRRAIRIIESGNGKNDPMLIEPLRRMGESFYYIDLTASSQQTSGLVSSGEIYFKRAARIANKAEDLDWRDWAAANLALADFYTFIDHQNRSRKIYLRVWEGLSDNDERIAARDEMLGKPTVTRGESLPDFVGVEEAGGSLNNSGLITGRIVVDYTVSSRGRVRDLRTEAIPPEFTAIQRMVHREIRQRIYRPQIVNGAPVNAENQVFEHRFAYTQDDLDELKRKKVAAADAVRRR